MNDKDRLQTISETIAKFVGTAFEDIPVGSDAWHLLNVLKGVKEIADGSIEARFESH